MFRTATELNYKSSFKLYRATDQPETTGYLQERSRDEICKFTAETTGLFVGNIDPRNFTLDHRQVKKLTKGEEELDTDLFVLRMWLLCCRCCA